MWKTLSVLVVPGALSTLNEKIQSGNAQHSQLPAANAAHSPNSGEAPTLGWDVNSENFNKEACLQALGLRTNATSLSSPKQGMPQPTLVAVEAQEQPGFQPQPQATMPRGSHPEETQVEIARLTAELVRLRLELPFLRNQIASLQAERSRTQQPPFAGMPQSAGYNPNPPPFFCHPNYPPSPPYVPPPPYVYSPDPVPNPFHQQHAAGSSHLNGQPGQHPSFNHGTTPAQGTNVSTGSSRFNLLKNRMRAPPSFSSFPPPQFDDDDDGCSKRHPYYGLIVVDPQGVAHTVPGLSSSTYLNSYVSNENAPPNASPKDDSASSAAGGCKEQRLDETEANLK
jgi:hypothetical protein